MRDNPIKYIFILIAALYLWGMTSCEEKKEVNTENHLTGINEEIRNLLNKAEKARKEGRKDDAIILFKKCIDVPEGGSDSVTANLVARAMLELFNTYQWAEEWHEGAAWFDRLYQKPTNFISRTCMRDLGVFTAMSLSRDNMDSIAEVIIEKSLSLPAINYTPWKYYRDYAYASAIMYANPLKTDKAIEYAKNAIRYADLYKSSTGDNEAIGKSYVVSTLGKLYQRSGRLKEGSDLIRESIAEAIAQKDTLAQINGYNALTGMMLYWGVFTQATEYSDMAMAALQNFSGLVKDPLVEAMAYTLKGRVVASQGGDSVMYFWNKAEEMASKMPYNYGADELDLLIGEYFMNIPDSTPKAKKRLLKVIDGGTRENVAKAYHLMARIARREGDAQLAVEYADSMYAANMSGGRGKHVAGGNAFALSLALENDDAGKIKLYSKAFLEEYGRDTNPMDTRQLTEIVARHYLNEKNNEVAMEKAKIESRFMIMVIILSSAIVLLIMAVISMVYRNRLARTRKQLLEARLNSLLSSNSIIRSRLENERKKNSEIQGNLELIVNNGHERQKIGAEALSRIKTSDGMGDFLNMFNVLYPSFLQNLKERVPDIGKREQLLSMLIVLGCDSERISNLMNITPKSVNMARWRLRKKLALTPEQSLDDIIKSLADTPADEK